MRYLTYSKYMKERYGKKVYKLPVSLPVSCPNRESGFGRKSAADRMGCGKADNMKCADHDEADHMECDEINGEFCKDPDLGERRLSGCTFCGAKGAGFENLSEQLSVEEQLGKNMEYIGKRYGAESFAAYFQNFTNTYLPLEELDKYLEDAFRVPQIVEVCISTRPDCVSDPYLSMIAEKCEKYAKRAVLELGLQSISHRTLKKINRGHTLAEFIDAAVRCRGFGLEVCAHLILNLPWDDDSDAAEAAKILTALGVSQVKLHSLYIEKNTELCRQYERGEFQLISAEEYARRVVLFLSYLSPGICVQRLVSRAPEEDTVFCNWGMSWWRVRDRIEEIMESENISQGDRCNYLGRDYYFWNRR